MHVEGVWKDIYLDVKKALNYFYDHQNLYITVKKIRKYLEIPASDRSKINFIWRILQYFEREGYLAIIKDRSPKQYKIAKFPILNGVINGELNGIQM